MGAYSGVYRSTDDGINWEHVKTNIVESETRALAILSNDNILAGVLFEGIFQSTDAGTLWTETDSGLAYNGVTSIAVDSTKFIYAGTLRGGESEPTA